MREGWLGFFLALPVFTLLAWLVRPRQSLALPWRLYIAGFCLRVVGSLARYWVITDFYQGMADALGYFGYGVRFAEALWRGDLSVLSWEHWFGGQGRWWGTPFLRNLSGVVVALVGPSLPAGFLAFAFLGFLGVVLTARAAEGWLAPNAARWVARVLMLWPSLWFWPSSMGKEAVVTFAFGLAVYGATGRSLLGRLPWLLSGLALLFCVRPHFAGFLALALAASAVLRPLRAGLGLTLGRAVFLVPLAVGAALLALENLGVGGADLEGIAEFRQEIRERTLQGGSRVERLPGGPLAPVLGVLNTWARPFPWEVRNLTQALAAGEILLFWVLMLRGSRGPRYFLRAWRQNPLTRLALLALVGFSAVFGTTYGNLGILARQRAPLFLFLALPLGFSLLFWRSARTTPVRARAAVSPTRPAPSPARAKGGLQR